MRDITQAASSELMMDVAALRLRDAAFRGDYDRYVLGHAKLLPRIVAIVGFALLAPAVRGRAVPWTSEELIGDIRRRLGMAPL